MRQYRATHPNYKQQQKEQFQKWKQTHPTYFRDRERRLAATSEEFRAKRRKHSADWRRRYPEKKKVQNAKRYCKKELE